MDAKCITGNYFNGSRSRCRKMLAGVGRATKEGRRMLCTRADRWKFGRSIASR